MAEVRQYCCCTNNLTACKIVGGVQIALNAIVLIIFFSLFNEFQSQRFIGVATFVAVVFGSGFLSAILLVVAASKRSATMLMVWIVLNGIGIGLGVIGLFRPFFFDSDSDYSLIGSFISIGLEIWAELIAIGARLEVIA